MWLSQELDEYDTFYKKNMENSGYSSIYIQRSGDKRDGCGIFYKPKRYWYSLDLYILPPSHEKRNPKFEKNLTKSAILEIGFQLPA